MSTAAYDALSAEDKVRIDALMKLLRPIAGEFARLGNHGAAVNDVYVAGASGALSLLAAGDEIPNKSGFDDAMLVTQAQVITQVAMCQNFYQGTFARVYNTTDDRINWARLAGGTNMLG